MSNSSTVSSANALLLISAEATNVRRDPVAFEVQQPNFQETPI
jgi:hypothetical protein